MARPFGGWAPLALLLVQGAPQALAVSIGAPPAAPTLPCAQERGATPLSLASVLIPAVFTPEGDAGLDYRHRLQTTPLGWPLQSTWCVWVEPAEPASAAQGPAQWWQLAVERALEQWQQELPIVRVSDPGRAQVRIWRRRPPLGVGADGRARASHGRATLSLQGLGPDPAAGVEPRVEVLISPGQRQEAIQATALHELGHAFGLWGHSDQPGDAMAVAPMAKPVLELSPRDRATLRWLYQQPTPMRSHP
ncbi:MAG: peptidase [Cyanobacteriota bacterium]|nr:peptidase [Cyanobacteriota bacterium]